MVISMLFDSQVKQGYSIIKLNFAWWTDGKSYTVCSLMEESLIGYGELLERGGGKSANKLFP